MSEPVAFISHFAVKPGKRDDLRQLYQDSARRLEAEKPRTLVFLAYFNEAGTQVSFFHVFADAEALDLHFEGSDERARAAYVYLEPQGWEFYGRPSQAVLETMRHEAASAGVSLIVDTDYLGGFLRLGPS
ncbi:MAG: putative quinol monooxygenase [Candidatus Limnocylindria bacterium]